MLITSTVGNLVEPLTGRQWGPGEILIRWRARAAHYARLGLKRGDRVFLHYGNNLEFFVDLLAIWHAGACAVPVDGRLTLFEVQTLAQSGRPRFSVWNEMPDAAMQSVLEACGATVLEKPGAELPTDGTPPPPGRLILDDDALVLYTSGTTGNPKGVVHTHRSLRAQWMSLRAALGLEAYRRTLCLLPTHFGHGLICNCLFPWLFGQSLYVLPPFRADILIRLGELIDEHRITFLSSVPTVWRLALKTARPPTSGSLSRVFCGSAPLSAALWESVQEWSGTASVMNAYGITETGSWLAGTTVPFERPADGLVGEAWGGVLRILRTDDPLAPPGWSDECAADEAGHVWINTPALMRGYLDRDDLTSKVVSQGWFSTGDIGLMDGRGYLYLRGREREEINKGGMKVYPADIDAVIERFPETLDVCTFPSANELLGEEVAVAVVLSSASDETWIRLYEWTTRHLAAHQVPKRWYLIDEIPRTSRGKINRASVAAHCAGRSPIAYARLHKHRD